jgi:hypothetical protein
MVGASAWVGQYIVVADVTYAYARACAPAIICVCGIRRHALPVSDAVLMRPSATDRLAAPSRISGGYQLVNRDIMSSHFQFFIIDITRFVFNMFSGSRSKEPASQAFIFNNFSGLGRCAGADIMSLSGTGAAQGWDFGSRKAILLRFQ